MARRVIHEAHTNHFTHSYTPSHTLTHLVHCRIEFIKHVLPRLAKPTSPGAAGVVEEVTMLVLVSATYEVPPPLSGVSGHSNFPSSLAFGGGCQVEIRKRVTAWIIVSAG